MPVNQQLTEEPQIGIEPMTASLLVGASSRFPSVAPSEAGVVEAPKNVRFRQNARRSGEQVVSRKRFSLSPKWMRQFLVGSIQRNAKTRECGS